MSRDVRVGITGALATLLTSATLLPLLDGQGWLVPVILTLIAVCLGGWGIRRVTRAPLAVALAMFALVLLIMTALFARDTAVLGVLPSPASLQHLASLWSAGLEATRTSAAPVPTGDGLTFVVTCGIGLVAAAVDVIAVALREPAAAGLPLLAVYCVPAALAPGGLDWSLFVVPAIGYLALIASDAGDRVRRWGRVLATPHTTRAGSEADENPLASTGWQVGALAVAAAVLLPTVVPGLGQSLLPGGPGFGNGNGRGGTITVINPILNLRDDLTARADTTVLTYQTTATNPPPLRIVTDDLFDGRSWSPATSTISRSNRPQSGLPSPPGLGPDVPRTAQSAQVRIGPLEQTYLPLPYPSTRVDITGPWLYEADTLNVVGDGANTKDTSYSVQFLQVTPTAAELRAADPPPASLTAQFTKLPQSLPAVIAETARTVTSGQTGSYDQAVALQQWFRSSGGFQYTTDAPKDNGSDAVAEFLQQRRGYCVQFASAMAVMARTLGIPARVAVGFLPGTATGNGSYKVSVRDAHAWPELYFEGAGWVRFEPTPAARVAQLPSWATPPVTGGDPSGSAGAAAGASSAPTAGPAPTRRPDAGSSAGSGSATTRVRVPWRTVGTGVLVLAILALPLAARLTGSSRRWRRARREVDAVEAAWADLTERLGDIGVSWPPTSTPRQAAGRIVARVGGPARPDVGVAATRLATALEQARYAPRPPEPDGLRHDVRTVLQGARAVSSGRTRLRAALMPASGVMRVGASITAAARASGELLGTAVAWARAKVGDRGGTAR